MDYSIRNGSVAGRDAVIPIRDYLPADAGNAAALLWIRGGGFTSGSLDQKESDAPARELAARGRWVRTVDYRRAPKLSLWRKLNLSPHANRFPAAHNDVMDVVASLRADSGRAINLGGASAGANLAAGAALALRDNGASDVRALVLAYGTFHAQLPPRPEVAADLTGPLARWLFNPSMTHRMNLNYVGDASLLTHGYAFPGGADLHGLPPALVLNSKNDRLRQSGDTFIDELRAAGVEVAATVIDAPHAYLNAPRSAGFREGMELIAGWLDLQD